MIKEKNENLEKELHELFNSKIEQEKLKAAAFLLKYQNVSALAYITSLILKYKKLFVIYWSIDYFPFREIKSINAIPYISTMLEAAFEKDFEDKETYSFKSILMDVFRNIAFDNPEKNFPIVKESLEQFIENNSSKSPEVNYIYSMIEELKKQFYIIIQKPESLEEAIRIAKKLIK